MVTKGVESSGSTARAHAEEMDDLTLKQETHQLEHAQQTGDLAAMLAALEEEIMPGVPLIKDKAFEKKLVRKLDLRLQLMLMCIYVLSYLDRGNIAYAVLGSLKQDVKLDSTQYATVIGIFYAGYNVTQIPSNIVMAKLRPSRVLAFVMIAWGLVDACTGAVTNYSGMIACRFFLGVVEAPFFPAAIYLLSTFYTRKELSLRISLLHAAGLMAGAFGGLLATAIMTGMDGKAGLASWRWLFIIEGVLVVPVAAVAIYVLPDYPNSTRWLTPEEKKLAIYRLAAQNISTKTSAQDDIQLTIPQSLKAAFVDPNTYLITLALLAMNTSASFIQYFPTIVKGLGFGSVTTYLLTAPPYVVAATLQIINCAVSDHRGERWSHVLFGQGIALVGFIISLASSNIGARYFACFLQLSIYASFSILFSWIQTSTPTPAMKKAIVYAFNNGAGNIAPIYSTYFYPASDGPRYIKANIINVVFSILCIVFATVLRIRLKKLNTKLDEAEQTDLANEGHAVGTESQRLQKRYLLEPGYRYTL